jgi:arylsulfatase A-like enzyme
MTGQYPACTGVTQTDGMFKSADDVPFLDSIGAPTIGDWFRAAGYTTHYFGKWHVSEPKAPHYLEPWGFSNWESSYPEPHGGASDNLGVYRDVVFADNAVKYFENLKANPPDLPWLTVASIVNPHDVSSWPINWQVPGNKGVVGWENYPPPLLFPIKGAQSLTGTVPNVVNGVSVDTTFQVNLNPDGFPQENSDLPLTFFENMANKPRCQFDFSYKWGLAFGALDDVNLMVYGPNYMSPEPFQLQGAYYEEWSRHYLQFYFYAQYLADLQIRRVLDALDKSGQAANTIVIFLSDHGDMTAAHGGMLQKWHTAYEEAVRVPMIISSPLVNSSKDVMREIMQPTSSIDLAPTLLGLAGFKEADLRGQVAEIQGIPTVKPLAGADLSAHIKGTATGPITGPDGNPRTGVLFLSDDMITELKDSAKIVPYNLFLHRVDSTINLGYPLAHGTVRQPNNPQAFCTGDWKLVKYNDPNGLQPDEWEFYCLASDPIETDNLVDYSTGLVRDDAYVSGMTHQEIVTKNELMKVQLSRALGVAQPNTDILRARLFQNIPNPFSGATEISFSIPAAGRTRLTITDLSGREVVVLADAMLTLGLHKYRLDGNLLTPGAYFLRLSCENQHLTRKMIVIR